MHEMKESNIKYPIISYNIKVVDGKIVRTNFRWQDEDGNFIEKMSEEEAELLS